MSLLMALERNVDDRSQHARSDDDEGLIDALRAREPIAAKWLVARYGDRAYRVAIGITGNQPDAEEAVQDTFMNVVRKIDAFRGDAGLASWIYRSVANAACQKRWSGRRRREISLGMRCHRSTNRGGARRGYPTGRPR